jgi:ATP-dependent RNA helicase RhlE
VSFEEFGLNESILAGIRSLGYTTPTPVQSKAIPNTLLGHDVMGLAQTGTGKTAAYVLPMLNRLNNVSRGTGSTARKKVRALIVAPTRELAEQIDKAIKAMGKRTPFKSMAIYGGASFTNQENKLRQGVDIIVACPGRLLDHINQGKADLSSVEMLVLDEADRMLDMGFIPDIRKILRHVPGKRQTLLFSATMPDDIRTLTKQIMNRPVIVQVDHSMPAKTISHALYPVAEHLKTTFLIRLLRNIESKSVLVFTRTKHRAKRVTDRLQRDGFKATPLQGNMTQGRRQESLSGFRNGKYRILVATDLAARGMDISSISHVINYDMPDTADAYTHRVGRTGRAARTGEAFSLVTQADKSTVQSFERTMGIELVIRELEGFDYNMPASRKQVSAFGHNTAPRKQTAAPYGRNKSSHYRARRRAS